LTTKQMAALTTAQVAALTTAQIVALEDLDVAALTTSGIVSLTTAQVAKLTNGQVAAMTTAQIRAMATDDLAVLSVTQLDQWSATQTMALTTAQLAVLTTNSTLALATAQISPLVLDLNGDGIQTLSLADGVRFDLGATGHAVRTGWVSDTDGLLVLDRNGDGVINDGSELFGEASILPDGETAAHGYVALKAMDTNGDGVINNQDARWADLQVWTDGNSNGLTDEDELASLDSLGITQLDAQPTATSVANNGNWVGLISSFEMAGETHDMADVWFTVAKDPDLTTQVTGLTRAISAFNSGPTERGADAAGNLTDTPPTEETIAATVHAMTVALANYNPCGIAGSQVSASTALLRTALLDNEPDKQLAMPS
jgi:hypothetical protein